MPVGTRPTVTRRSLLWLVAVCALGIADLASGQEPDLPRHASPLQQQDGGQSLQTPKKQATLECPCQQVVRGMTNWCDKHQVGYVASIAIRSKMLHEAIDAHGHDIDVSLLTCKQCIAASESGGFCDACQFGFVDELAYLSDLTYCIARGEVVLGTDLKCETCRKHARGDGWCAACNVGRVGHLQLADQTLLEPAKAAFQRLFAALRHLRRCEVCCTAAFTGGGCRFCNRSFADQGPRGRNKEQATARPPTHPPATQPRLKPRTEPDTEPNTEPTPSTRPRDAEPAKEALPQSQPKLAPEATQANDEASFSPREATTATNDAPTR
ncbi:MAG: hypothetical protein AAF581_06280 [Planctomycetota bacterium]